MAFFMKNVINRHNLCFTFMGHRTISTSLHLNSKKVAVVLSGCGVYDGSEIHEASATLVHLTRGGAEPVIYAPDQDQMHVVNHVTGEPSVNEKRNVLVESARIARGKILPLSQLSSAVCDAVVFPGGFGAAKNLSTFATEGADCKIIPDVEKIIKDFHSAKKPIALCCISPTLIARVLPKIQVTLGQDKDDGSGKWPYAGAAEAVKNWGATHVNKNVNECVVDKTNLIVTTPAFMYDTTNFHKVYDGIGVMINSLLALLKK